MKRKFILLPLTLTAFTPVISMAACNNSGPEIKIDSGSDITDIKISVPKIILNQELIITYEMINQEKVLDINNSWIKFDSSQFPLSNPEFKCENNKIIIPAEKVTTYDITICLKSMDPDIPTSIELSYGQGLKDDIKITHDQTLTFSCVVYPSTAPQDFELSSSDRAVVDFEGGNILKPNPNNNKGGTAEIFAKCKEYPGIVSNIIKVTVLPRPSTMSIDYSNVNFDTTITVGATESRYEFKGFDADFIFDKDHFFGEHSVTPHATWNDGTGLQPLTVEIDSAIQSDSHTTFNVVVSCPFTQWEIEHKYYYSLYFVIDEGTPDEKRIDVDKELFFINHTAKTPEITEPSTATLVPDDYGASVTIKGCTTNFRIGADFQNTLELGLINIISGYDFATYADITNIQNTQTGATFDIKANCDGLDLSQDIVFNFNYKLNGVKLKTSQNYTIKSNKFIKCDQELARIELDDFDTPSAIVDNFIANFEFDNQPTSSLPIISASCESWDPTIANPSVSVVNIVKGTGTTTFSLQIVFASPISEPWVQKRFNIRFKIDGVPLVSDNIWFNIETPPTLQYFGDGGPQQLVHGKYYEGFEEEEHEGYFTTIGVFAGGHILSDQITAEFEWNTSNALPTPSKILVGTIYEDIGDLSYNYITLVWPSAFTPDASTFKLNVLVDGTLTLTLDGLSLLPLSSDNNFWNIEPTFVGSSGSATISKNTQDEIIIDLSGYETNKELWGIEFNYGDNFSLTMTGKASINASHNKITIKPDRVNCRLIPGLKSKVTITYVSPNDIKLINQTEMYEGVMPFYTSNEIDWKAGQTYYLRADFHDSSFVFEDNVGMHMAFIGEFSETGIMPISDFKVYNNCFATEQGMGIEGMPGMCGFYSWAETASSLKNSIMNFTIKIGSDLGLHKFKIAHGA